MRLFIFLILFISTLFASQNMDKKDFLNVEERKWLNDNKTIKMCANPIWAPIGFYNKKTKQPEGISIDIMKLVESKLSQEMKFQYIHTLSWKESQKFLKEGKCDFISLFNKNAKREKYALFTKPYVSYKFAIITRNDKPFVREFSEITDKSIVRKKGSGMIYKLKRNYPGIHIIETKDFLDSLQMVSKGEAYAAIATLPVLSYNANRLGINNVQIAGYTDMETHLSIGVRKDNPTLHSILDKALAQITADEHKKIQDKWMSVQIQEVKSNSAEYILLSVLLFIIVVYYFYQNSQSKKSLTELNNTLEKKVQEQTKDLLLLNDELKSKNQELEILNDKMKEQVEEQLTQLRNKDKQLIEQSKMMAMGEMIGNIAHQWRQPLNVISTQATGVLFQKELGAIEDARLEKSMEVINDHAQYLSKTIDTFKNFIKSSKDKELVETTVQSEIENAHLIASATLQNNYISFLLDICDEEIKIRLSDGELSQVLINIINNAKDVLKENNVEDERFIKLVLKKENGYALITIEDNGGGIPQDILPRIFEPYFTTKHQSQGTGLGLHMSYQIVTKSFDGKIYACNTQSGAKFFIELPLV